MCMIWRSHTIRRFNGVDAHVTVIHLGYIIQAVPHAPAAPFGESLSSRAETILRAPGVSGSGFALYQSYSAKLDSGSCVTCLPATAKSARIINVGVEVCFHVCVSDYVWIW